MWLPVISPGGSAKGGCPAGRRGRCCSWGHPHSSTRQIAAPPETQGGKGGLRRVWGTLASRGHWARGCCWHMQAADGLGRPSGTPPGVGVGGSSASLNGRGCCESAGLDPPHRAETPKVQSPLASSICLLMYLPKGTQPRRLRPKQREGTTAGSDLALESDFTRKWPKEEPPS